MFRWRAGGHKTCSVHDYKQNTRELGENLNITKYHERCFHPCDASECMEGLFRAQQLLQASPKSPYIHYGFQPIAAYPHTISKFKNYMSCSFFAKLASFILSVKCHTEQTECIIVTKCNRLKLRHPKKKGKKNSNSKTILHSSSERIPFEAFQIYLLAENKRSSLLECGGGLLVAVWNQG